MLDFDSGYCTWDLNSAFRTLFWFPQVKVISAFSAQHPFLLLPGAVSQVLFRKRSLPQSQPNSLPEIRPHLQLVSCPDPRDQFRKRACGLISQSEILLSLQESLFLAQLGSLWLGPAALMERQLNWPHPEPSQERQTCGDTGDWGRNQTAPGRSYS